MEVFISSHHFIHSGQNGMYIFFLFTLLQYFFQIIFPTGTFAKIMLHDQGFWFINLEVYPTVSDVSSTSGLCGFLDNDKTNDFKRRDGTQDSIHSMPPDPFSLSWRLVLCKRLTHSK